MYTKLRCLRCFNSGLFTKQPTNHLKEVVPFCKSGHIYQNIGGKIILDDTTQ